MGDYGFKTSVLGANVRTAAAKDLVVSSARNCLKVDNVVATTITTDGSGVGSKTINHGLGFVPVNFIAINFGGAYYFEPFNGVGTVDLFIYASVTTTQIVINLDSLGNPNTTYDLYYWLSETETAI